MGNVFPPLHPNQRMTVDDYVARGSSAAIYINQLVSRRREGCIPDEVRLFANLALDAKEQGVYIGPLHLSTIVGDRTLPYQLNSMSPIGADLVRAGVALYTEERRTGIHNGLDGVRNDGNVMPTEKRVIVLTHFMSPGEINGLQMQPYNLDSRNGLTMFNHPLPNKESRYHSIRMAVLLELISAGHLPEWMTPRKEVKK